MGALKPLADLLLPPWQGKFFLTWCFSWPSLVSRLSVSPMPAISFAPSSVHRGHLGGIGGRT